MQQNVLLKILVCIAVALSAILCFSSCSNECVCRHNYANGEWYENMGEMSAYDCDLYEMNMRYDLPTNHSVVCSTTKFKGKY